MLPTYTSHEVYIDDKQIDWFEEVARTHPAADGWKIFVFSHAPPMVMTYGTLVRDLQHFKRLCFIREVDFAFCKRTMSSIGAALLNHWGGDYDLINSYAVLSSFLSALARTSSQPGGASARRFIEIVRGNSSCIKAWFSGHFHLGQDYQDGSLTFPKGNANRNDCTFAQTSVMSRKSTRDGRRQSRLVLHYRLDYFYLTTYLPN